MWPLKCIVSGYFTNILLSVGRQTFCPMVQSVASLTADPGIVKMIPAQSHTFVEIDHEIISMVIITPPSADSRRVVVSYKCKYVREVLANGLVKLAQENLWLGELTLST